MTKIHYTSEQMLSAMYIQQMVLQAQLIEAQQKIIALQEEIATLKPDTPKDEDVFWHIHSGGIFSKDAAESEDYLLVKKFRDWNIDLAKKHVKPYVNPKVYGEVLNQMTRGLPEHLSKLQTREEIEHGRPIEKIQTEQDKQADTGERIVQLKLLQNA